MVKTKEEEAKGKAKVVDKAPVDEVKIKMAVGKVKAKVVGKAKAKDADKAPLDEDKIKTADNKAVEDVVIQISLLGTTPRTTPINVLRWTVLLVAIQILRGRLPVRKLENKRLARRGLRREMTPNPLLASAQG